MKVISTIAIILAVICMILGTISAIKFIGIGARTLATGSALLYLLAISINTSK